MYIYNHYSYSGLKFRVSVSVKQNFQQQSLDALCCCSNLYQYRFIIIFFPRTDTSVSDVICMSMNGT